MTLRAARHSAVRQPMLRAIHSVLADRLADPQEARAIAVAQAAPGKYPQSIATFQAISAW